MGEMCYMDETGDTKLIWDPENQDEVQNAREMFDKLKAKNFIAYAVKKKGEKGEVIMKFDPEAGRIIMTPMLNGG